jgi:AraC-like DNA-binding protein
MLCVEGCMGQCSGTVCQGILVSAERKASRSGQALQYRCPAGLEKVLVPVMVDGKHLGNLLAGPFSTGTLDAPRLQRLTRNLKQWGLESQVDGLRASWSGSLAMTAEKVRAVEALLEMFAQYLADAAKKIAAHEDASPSPLLQKIEAHLADAGQQALTVRELAERLHISPCHFCRFFKKQTGVTFTQYRTRLRVESAKRLLLDPHRRITEVAYEAGFDSIPYFNRAFRRLAGCSPTEFRSRQSRGPSIQVKRRSIPA